MITMYYILYGIGCILSYVMIVSITENTFSNDKPRKAGMFLIVLTIITYVVSSWVGVILFGIISFIDPHFRRLVLFPLHFKTKLKR